MESIRWNQLNVTDIELYTPLTMAVVWLVNDSIDVLNATADTLDIKPYIPLTQPYIAECIRCILNTLLKIIDINPSVLDFIDFRGSAKGKISEHIKNVLHKYEDIIPLKSDLDATFKGCRIREEPHLLFSHDNTFITSPPLARQFWFAPRSNRHISMSLYDNYYADIELSILYYIVTLVLGDQRGDESILTDMDLASTISREFNLDIQLQNKSNVIAVLIARIVVSWLYGIMKQHTNACSKYWKLTNANKIDTKTGQRTVEKEADKIISDNLNTMYTMYRKFGYDPLIFNDSVVVRECLWKLFTAYDVHLVDYEPYTVQRFGAPGMQNDNVTTMFTLPLDAQLEYCKIVHIDISALPTNNMTALQSYKYPHRTKSSRMIANFEDERPPTIAVCTNDIELNRAFRIWLLNKVNNVTSKRKIDEPIVNVTHIDDNQHEPLLKKSCTITNKPLNTLEFNELMALEISKPDKVDWFFDESIAWTPLSKDTIKSIATVVLQSSLCNVTKRIVQLVCDISDDGDDDKFVSQIDGIPFDSWMSDQDALNLESNCNECIDCKMLVICLRTLVQRRILVATAQLNTARSLIMAEHTKLEQLQENINRDYNNKLQILELKQHEIETTSNILCAPTSYLEYPTLDIALKGNNNSYNNDTIQWSSPY